MIGFRSVLLGLGLLLALGCRDTGVARTQGDASGGDPADDGLSALSEEEQAWFEASLPGAVKQRLLPIPEELLTDDDVEAENTSVIALFDVNGVLLGYARDIFTDVECNGGACRAIRFMLVFDVALAFLDIFHQPERENDFMKYWQDEYLPFTEADRALLKSLLANPPAELLAVSDVSTLVVGASITAPTQPAYQELVVRGAAFTTYIALMYRMDTQSLVSEMVD